MSGDILSFPLSTYPRAAEISLSMEIGRAQLGQLSEYIQNRLGSKDFSLNSWAFNFVLRGEDMKLSPLSEVLQTDWKYMPTLTWNRLESNWEYASGTSLSGAEKLFRNTRARHLFPSQSSSDTKLVADSMHG